MFFDDDYYFKVHFSNACISVTPLFSGLVHSFASVSLAFGLVIWLLGMWMEYLAR